MLLNVFICFLLVKHITSSNGDGFTFNGFIKANLTLDGLAQITSDGLLQLTNLTEERTGHAFYPSPLRLRDPKHGNISSFSTTFVFAIHPEYANIIGHGLAFLISPTTNFSSAYGNQYLGLFNDKTDGKSSNNVFAVTLSTIFSPEFQDQINQDHVGININSMTPIQSYPAGYYVNDDLFQNLNLGSGKPIQVWIDYDSQKELNVTIAPFQISKPFKPIITAAIDLSTVFQDLMYVGFSASTDSLKNSHYVLSWSFKVNGAAKALDGSMLPSLPGIRRKGRAKDQIYIILPLSLAAVLLLLVAIVTYVVRRNLKYTEVCEDWELQYGPHRFSYKDLLSATDGFKDSEHLGTGGFGRVYKGKLSSSNKEVAVKRMSHESRQGMREFVAEIVSVGRLRHRNLVQLLGYCRRKGELLLVYDYMSNGSLDKFLYDQTKPPMDWFLRFRIIKGVVSSLLYLHEDWEKVVIHRDIKASNVLLDNEMNARLGDFGLARLSDHGTDPHTTHLAGTLGYLAPELARTGKATKATDIFAFGVFILEVCCGRRPLEANSEFVLVDWVLEHWQKGAILQTTDPRLGDEYVVHEMELILKLGLLCTHPVPASRPPMRQIIHYLDGDLPFPELPPNYLNITHLSLLEDEGFNNLIVSYPSKVSIGSVLSGGR